MSGENGKFIDRGRAALRVGQDLAGFSFREMTEVYRVDTDGRPVATIGLFKDPNVAKVYAGQQRDADFHRTKLVLILTNGTIGFRFGEQIDLMDDEQVLVEVRRAALAKLTPEELAVLGFDASAAQKG